MQFTLNNLFYMTVFSILLIIVLMIFGKEKKVIRLALILTNAALIYNIINLFSRIRYLFNIISIEILLLTLINIFILTIPLIIILIYNYNSQKKERIIKESYKIIIKDL